MRFEQKLTLREIGDAFKLSRERVRQLVGNSGHYIKVEPLKAHKDHWAWRVFGVEDITCKEIGRKFNLSNTQVKRVIGTRTDYAKKIGKVHCCECRQWKEDKEFYRAKKGSDKPSQRCKFCSDANVSVRYHKDIELARKKSRDYQRAHKDKMLLYQSRWKETHLEQFRAMRRAYYAKNAEKIKAYAKEYRKKIAERL